jgi:hypothetical protein
MYRGALVEPLFQMYPEEDAAASSAVKMVPA